MDMLMFTTVDLMNSFILTNPHEVDLSDGKGVVYYIRVVDDEGRRFRYVDIRIQLLLGIKVNPK